MGLFGKRKTEEDLKKELKEVQSRRNAFTKKKTASDKLSTLKRQIRAEKNSLFDRKVKNSTLGKAARSKTAKAIGKTALQFGKAIAENSRSPPPKRKAQPKRRKQNNDDFFNLGF
jgi:hypothetical protein